MNVESAQGRLHARVWGDLDASRAAVPIVLLHDSLGSVALWRDFPAELHQATGHPVVAYDRLGFGRSSPHPGALARDFIRREADEGLRPLGAALGLNRMILFGHSVGGGMAIAAAAACPDLVAGVITEAAQAFVEDRTLAGIRAAAAAFAEPGQFERIVRYHGDKARWVLDAWTTSWLAPEFADWTLDDDLRRLQCPVLALHGDRDEYGTRRHPDRIAARAASGGSAALIADCGHVPHRERPEAVLRLAVDFVAGLEKVG